MKTKNIIQFALALLISVSAIAQEKKWSLKESVNHALENNITILQIKNTLLVNEQDIIAAKGQYLPSASGSIGSGVSMGSGFDPVTNQRINNEVTYSANYSVGANYTVFNGFRRTNLYKQSQLTLETNTLELARIQDDVSLNVVNAYLNILFNKENLETAKAQYVFSQKQLNQVQELVDAGVQPKANIYDAQATLSRDLQSVTVAENNYELSLLSLSQLLQVPFQNFSVEDINIDDPSVELLYKNVNPILDYALKNRNEIKVAEKNIESAKLGTEISKSGYYPSITANYSLNSVWSERDSDFIKESLFRELDENKGHRFGLSIGIPIFSQFQNKTAVAKSRIQEENALLGLEQAKLSLESNVQRAFTDAKSAYRSYEASKISLQSQELAFQNSEERYDIGMMNAFDLEQSRLRLLNAQASLINAKYDFVFKTKVLDFYLGKPITQ